MTIPHPLPAFLYHFQLENSPEAEATKATSLVPTCSSGQSTSSPACPLLLSASLIMSSPCPSYLSKAYKGSQIPHLCTTLMILALSSNHIDTVLTHSKVCGVLHSTALRDPCHSRRPLLCMQCDSNAEPDSVRITSRSLDGQCPLQLRAAADEAASSEALSCPPHGCGTGSLSTHLTLVPEAT